MKKDSEVLSDVRFALTPPEHWCQGSDARLKSGMHTDPNSRYAISWCLSGAVKISGGHISYFRKYFSIPATQSLIEYNDHPRRTHEQILNQLDRAIEKALKLEEINETNISS